MHTTRLIESLLLLIALTLHPSDAKLIAEQLDCIQINSMPKHFSDLPLQLERIPNASAMNTTTNYLQEYNHHSQFIFEEISQVDYAQLVTLSVPLKSINNRIRPRLLQPSYNNNTYNMINLSRNTFKINHIELPYVDQSTIKKLNEKMIDFKTLPPYTESATNHLSSLTDVLAYYEYDCQGIHINTTLGFALINPAIRSYAVLKAKFWIPILEVGGIWVEIYECHKIVRERTDGVKMRPPGYCTEELYRSLRDDKTLHCVTYRPWSCKDTMSCEQLLENQAKFQACAVARRTLSHICFGGADSGHHQASKDTERAATRCREIYDENCS